MQVLSKGRLALWLVVSLVFGVLLFAASAQAQETSSPDGTVDTPTGEAPPPSGTPPEEAASASEQAPPTSEQGSAGEAPPSEQGPTAPEEAAPVAEQAPPPTEEAPPASEPTPPATEEPPPATEQVPPVVEAAPPATEQAPPVTEQAPPVVEAPPASEPAPPVVEHAPAVAEEAAPVVEKKPVEATGGGEATVATNPEATQGPGEPPQAPAGTAGTIRKEATGEVAPENSIVLTPSVASAVPPEISSSPLQGRSPLALHPQADSSHGAGQVSCVRAAIAAGYTDAWLRISVGSPASIVSFANPNASSTAIAATTPDGNLGGGSAIENRPSSPGSGSGGGGGSAAGGGSGSGSSASSTLVDVLLQSAPRAMRRLRLSQPSWRTSFFVLIPERPD